MSRRGNGLSADTYAPLTDLTPEMADVMLSALREAGIAAYASPFDRPDTETASETVPDGPLDRLYVDTSMRSTAETVLRLHLTRPREDHSPESDTIDTPGTPDTADTVDTDTAIIGTDAAGKAGTSTPDERDDDAVWAEIVASFEATPEAGATPWPDEENVREENEKGDDAGGEADQEAVRDEGQDRTGRLPTARVIEPFGPSDAAPPEAADDEDHFVPPPPPPLPEGDVVSRAAWVALLGGPLYLLVTVLLGWEVPGWAAFLAVAAFIGGFVTLVLRMGDDPRGPDDGAVV
jgi:hypothetical protein